ncbi:hypothetical protein D3C73_712990 [compost metagenome]
MVRRYDRASQCHRLDDGQAETLIQGGKGKTQGMFQKIGDVVIGNPAGHYDIVVLPRRAFAENTEIPPGNDNIYSKPIQFRGNLGQKRQVLVPCAGSERKNIPARPLCDRLNDPRRDGGRVGIPLQDMFVAVRQDGDILCLYRQVAGKLTRRGMRNRRDPHRPSGEHRLDGLVGRPERQTVAVRRCKNVAVMDTDDLVLLGDRSRIAEIEQGATPFPRQNALFPRMAVEAAGDFNPRKGAQTWIGSAGRNKKRSDCPATACLIQGLQHIQGVALHAGWRLGQKAAVDCETILQAHR